MRVGSKRMNVYELDLKVKDPGYIESW
jgi:hypothetical protein